MSTLSSNKAVDYASPTTPPGLNGDGPVFQGPVFLGLRVINWIKVVTLVALFAAVFWPNLHRLWDKTNPFSGEDNWKHGLFVPLIGLYYLYLNRDALRAASLDSKWNWSHIVPEPVADWARDWQLAPMGMIFAIPLAPFAAAIAPAFLYLVGKYIIFLCSFWPSSSGMGFYVGCLVTLALYLAVGIAFAVVIGLVGSYGREILANIIRSAHGGSPWLRFVVKAVFRWTGITVAMAFLEGGIALYAYAIWPLQNDWFKDLGMIAALFGIVPLCCGWKVMKIAWFPIVFLICAIPWSQKFYTDVAGPMQVRTAQVSVQALRLVGVDASLGASPVEQPHGTKIRVPRKEGPPDEILDVAEACSGLKALMTFVAIAATMAFLSFRPIWQRFLMVYSAILVAILCNMLRITVQGIFVSHVSTQWSESFAHSFLGLMMMIPAFFMILLVGWVVQNIIIDEADDKRTLHSRGKSKRRGRSSSLQRVAAVPVASAAAVAPRAAGRTKTGSNSSPTPSAGASPPRGAATRGGDSSTGAATRKSTQNPGSAPRPSPPPNIDDRKKPEEAP